MALPLAFGCGVLESSVTPADVVDCFPVTEGLSFGEIPGNFRCFFSAKLGVVEREIVPNIRSRWGIRVFCMSPIVP